MQRAAQRLAALAAAVAAAACAPKRVARLIDASAARRFEIISATDTTFRFLAPGAKWVHAGQTGIAVDPRRRDALVARYVVQSLAGDTATALVTGQTTDVAPVHVALLETPRTPTIRQRAFWLGFFGGGVIAGAAAIVTR